MALTQSVCPHCEAALKFKTAIEVGKLVRCPKCSETFRLEPNDDPEESTPRNAKVAAIKTGKPKKPVVEESEDEAPEVKPKKKAPRAAVAEEDDEEEPEDKPKKKKSAKDSDELPAAKSKKKGKAKAKSPLLLIVAGVAVFFLVSGVAGAIIWKVTSKKESDSSSMAQGASKTEQRKDDSPRPQDKQQTDKVAQDKPQDKEPPDRTKNPNIPQPPPPLPPGQQPTLVLDSGNHTDAVRAVFFTPDGQRLVTAGLDKSIRIWDANSGECLRTIRMPVGPGREGAIQSAALSPDGKTLAVAGSTYKENNDAVMIYQVSLETGQVVRVFKKYDKDMVGGLAYSPNGKYLAVATMTGVVRIYPVDKDEAYREFRGKQERVGAIAWSPNGSQLAWGSYDSTIGLWTANTEKIATLQGHTTGIISLAWRNDGKGFASGSIGEVRLWSNTGAAAGGFKQMQTEPSGKAHQFQFVAMAYRKGDQDLLYAGIAYRGEAGIIDVTTGKKRFEVPFHSNTVLDGCFSPDGTMAVTTGGSNNETVVWDPTNGDKQFELPLSGKGVWGVGWGEDGKTIAWGNTNRGATVLGLTPVERAFSLDQMEVLNKPKTRFARSLLAKDGWEMQEKDFFEIGVFPTGNKNGIAFRSPYERDRLYSGTLLPGGRLLMGGSFGGIFLIDIKTQKLIRTYKGHSAIVLGLAPSPDGKYFVSGSSDQTIRVWDVEHEQPMMSLFVAGQDWIAWTPQGYYTASANGERLMGWQINNGLERVGNYFPAIQFRASLYRPDVMRVLLQAGSLDKALAMTGGNRPTVQVSQVLPPQVNIISPVPSGTVDVGAQTIEVKAVAQSFANYPVTSMRLLLDGRPYLGKKGIKVFDGARPGQVEATWNVALPPGKHSIAVLAESAVSKGVSTTLEVNRTNSKNELPNLYILAVGVSDYPGKLKLNYAASDALLISQTFQNRTKGVFKNVEVKTILNADATRQGIIEGMEWLNAKMSPVDVGILFFSGHGTKDEYDQFYLVPVDVSMTAPPSKWGVSGDYVKDSLANMPGRLIAIFDACHSGTVADSFKPSRGDNLVRDLVNDEYGVIVLCSSLGSEYSLESGATKAGFFTLALTEGMKGGADLNRDRLIHLAELSYFSSWYVRRLSDGEQNPIVGRPPHVKSFVVGKQ